MVRYSEVGRKCFLIRTNRYEEIIGGFGGKKGLEGREKKVKKAQLFDNVKRKGFVQDEILDYLGLFKDWNLVYIFKTNRKNICLHSNIVNPRQLNKAKVKKSL